MIEQALEEELHDLEAMERQPAAPKARGVDIKKPARTIDYEQEEETLAELEELIKSGTLSREERSMIEEALEEELRDLQAAEPAPVTRQQPKPAARSIDIDEEEETLNELEQLIKSGTLSREERAMIEDALEEELAQLEGEVARAQPPRPAAREPVQMNLD